MAHKYRSVPEFLAGLDDGRREQVESLRALVLDSMPGLVEGIKWNSPSYSYNGEDRITFNVRPGLPIRLVLHTGATARENRTGMATLTDTGDLLEWHSDIRASMVFASPTDIEDRAALVSAVLVRWLVLNST